MNWSWFSDKWICIGVLVISLSVFLLHAGYVGDAVWGDGRYYFSYDRSLVYDGDLNFTNEYELLGVTAATEYNGMAVNKFSFGAPLLWLPLYIVVDLFVRLFKVPGNGFGLWYQLMVGIGSVVYGCLGLGFIYLGLRRWFDRFVTWFSTLVFYFSSNMFFYVAIDPINSHSSSLFVSGLLFYLLSRWFDQLNYKKLAILGSLVGLLSLIRLQDGVIVIAIVMIIWEWKRKQVVLRGLILAAGFFGVLWLQLLMWYWMYGVVWSPYLLHGEQFNWLKPQILSVLFSLNHGLFPYSFVIIFTIVGLVMLIKKGDTKDGRYLFGLIGLVLFFVQLYVVSSWHSWWGGEAYGSRMFISVFPWMMIGIATMVGTVKSRVTLILIAVSLVVVNMATIGWYLLSV